MENVKNETMVYVLTLLKRVELEMLASQSAGLAVGFLDFDANRFCAELERIKKTVETEKPEDYPETHPESFLKMKAEVGTQ